MVVVAVAAAAGLPTTDPTPSAAARNPMPYNAFESASVDMSREPS